MAAVLCKGCSSVCDGCCKILSLPCKACGECCSIVTESLASLCTNPFCLYVTVALAFNIPSIAVSIPPLVNFGFGCQGLIWLIGNTAFCAFNIIAAFYVAIRFNQLRSNPTPSSTGGTTQSSGIKKTTEILCYDPFMAIYIVALSVYFVWLCIGVSWINSSCDYDTFSAISTAMGCGFGFFVAGFFALCFSVCCSCFCNEDRRESNPLHSQNQYGTTPTNNNTNAHASTYNDVEYAATASPVTAFPVSHAPSKKSSSQQEPIQATVVNDSTTRIQQATAPEIDNDSLDGEAKAAAQGTAIGAGISKLFKTDQKTQSKLETAGAKANVALNQAGKQANTALNQGLNKAKQIFKK